MNRRRYFGTIRDGEMCLSRIGVLADALWHEIPSHAKNVKLGAFQVMPDHFHGIVTLTESSSTGNEGDGTPAQRRAPNQGNNTVSSIIGSYKAAVTKHARRLGLEFEWQTRFYDRIIRNDRAYRRIQQYIIDNPKNWGRPKRRTR